VSEPRAIGRIVGPKRGEKSRRLGETATRKEELHNLYFSINIIAATKSKRMIWGSM
jgi:hypothetical protein